MSHLVTIESFDHKAFLKTLTQRPGVYCMYDHANNILYVGKANNLKKRVASYFRVTGLSNKTTVMVSKITRIDVTVTNSETEALLLEQSLIKDLRPPYNILLRDDKSYPYIFLSTHSDYPLLAFRRGAKREKGRYFGPYPSSGAVRETLHILQKVFLIRQCEDSFYINRTRPCLQYQIKRCTAPCVALISPEDYKRDVDHAVLFLEGKSQQLINDLASKMDEAANQLNFEQAAIYRDQIQKLSLIREQQYVVNEVGDVDVIACVVKPGGICVQILYVRDGRVLGNKTYFPKSPLDVDAIQVLSEFIPQFYLNGMGARDIPSDILINAHITDADTIASAISQFSERKVTISHSVRTHRARWLKLAITNAEQNLISHLANRQQFYRRFEALQEAFVLDTLPQRLECFDISHSSGEATVASCVVFDLNGPLKTDYRRFNIDGITEGDDYAAMKQALTRRYTRIKSGEGKLPDILFIDGGKGQLHQAEMVLEELQITDVVLIGIAKGEGRKPGLETLIVSGQSGEIHLPSDSPALHLIQQVRDEAHRFAITGHRGRRAKKRKESPLEEIPGVGPKRRRDLLRHFGGWQEIMRASAEELSKVPGIGQNKAQEIYAHLHND